MGISKYPRFGQRLAPSTLYDILGAEIPYDVFPRATGNFKSLADLNESIWQMASKETCMHLANMVVAEVHRNLKRLPLTSMNQLGRSIRLVLDKGNKPKRSAKSD
jgi:hypothetical protein